MRAKPMFVGMAAALFLFSGSVAAQTQVPSTPTSLDMIRFEPVGGELRDNGLPVPLVLDTMETVAERQSYLIYTRIDMNGASPTYRLPNLRDDLAYGFGMWGQASHGFQAAPNHPWTPNEWGFAAEVHATIDSAQAAGLWYVNSATFDVRDFFLINWGNSSWQRCALVVTPQFVRRYFRDWQTLVYDVTCSSLMYAHAWHDTLRSRNARVRLGYQGVCYDAGVPCNAFDDQNNLFKNMDGSLGNGHLNVFNAMGRMCSGSLLRVSPGDNQFTYLSPTVDRGLSYMPQSISSRTTVRLVFPVDMDRSINPYNYVLGTPAVRAYNPRWASSRELQITLVGRRQDWGWYGVKAYNHFVSPVFYGARSDSGYVPMDGDGTWFNRDDLWEEVYSNYVDANPAASVIGYTVTREGGNVAVRWQATQEGATTKYVVLYAPDFNGPFETVSEVQPGAGTYVVTVPGGADGIYRLVELEKNGEQRDVASEPVSSELPTVTNGDIHLKPSDFARADSLVSAAAEQLASTRTESAWAGDQYRIFTARRFQRPAEWLRDFWNSVGLPTEVVYIEDLGGPLGIQSYADSHLEMTAALLAGDASETSDPAGAQVFAHPSSWDTLGFGAQPAVQLQPELNVIPMFYRYSPDSLDLAMPYWRRYAGSILPYFDRNRNGKPDDGIRFGVAPVSDTTEFWGFAFKTANAFFQPVGRRGVDLWGYFRGGTSDEWRYALGLLDSLADRLPSTLDISRLTDSFLHVMTTQERQSQAIARLNAAPVLVVTGSVFDDMYSLGKFLQADHGARPNQLNPNPDGLTAIWRGCGGTAYNLTEDPVVGIPQMEPLLFTPDRGAYLIWGPNVGSDARGNFLIIDRAASLLFGDPWNPPPDRPFGDVANEALCSVVDEHPELADLVWQWNLLGDPNLTIKAPGPPVVGVDRGESVSFLSVFPNPGRRLNIRFSLGSSDDARIEVFDVQGRRVSTLVDGRVDPGPQSLAWAGQSDDGRPLASGLYLVRLRSKQFNADRKLVWLR